MDIVRGKIESGVGGARTSVPQQIVQLRSAFPDLLILRNCFFKGTVNVVLEKPIWIPMSDRRAYGKQRAKPMAPNAVTIEQRIRGITWSGITEDFSMAKARFKIRKLDIDAVIYCPDGLHFVNRGHEHVELLMEEIIPPPTLNEPCEVGFNP